MVRYTHAGIIYTYVGIIHMGTCPLSLGNTEHTSMSSTCTQGGRQNSTGGAGNSRSVQEVPEDLGQLAATKLLQLYAKENPTLVPVVKSTLTAMGFR